MYEFMHLLFFCDIDLKVYGDNKNGGYMKKYTIDRRFVLMYIKTKRR